MSVIKRGIADIVLTAPIVNSVVVATMCSAIKPNVTTATTAHNAFNVRIPATIVEQNLITVVTAIAVTIATVIAQTAHMLTAFPIVKINYTVIRRKNGLLKTRYLPKRNSFRNEHCHQ
jgi:hypothetical protein